MSKPVWGSLRHECRLFPACRAPRPAWRSTWSTSWRRWSPTRSPRAAWSASCSRSCPPKWYGPPSSRMLCDRTMGLCVVHPTAMLLTPPLCVFPSNTQTITPSLKTQSIWGSSLKRFRSVFTCSLWSLDQGYAQTNVQHISTHEHTL